MIQPYIIFLLGAMCTFSTGLECWKCIGEWCTDHPVGDYRVSKMSCQKESSCMKVYYKMYDNTSRIYESVTRSCSMGKCVDHGMDKFKECMANPRIYQIDGCSLRTCCNDRDLCNNSSRATVSRIVIFFIIYVVCVRQ